MSRGTKSKAVSEGKDSPPQDESGSGDIKMADHFRMITQSVKKPNDNFQAMDSHFEDFVEIKIIDN